MSQNVSHLRVAAHRAVTPGPRSDFSFLAKFACVTTIRIKRGTISWWWAIICLVLNHFWKCLVHKVFKMLCSSITHHNLIAKYSLSRSLTKLHAATWRQVILKGFSLLDHRLCSVAIRPISFFLGKILWNRVYAA